MKTIAVTSPGQVEIIDTPIPKPGPYQALVKTELACICNNTDGEPDAVIDAVGNTRIINDALPLLKRGGSICVYGFLAGLADFTIDNSLGDFNCNLFMHQWPTRLYEKEAQVTLCEWVREGKLSASEFIALRFSIDQISDALEAVGDRKVIKALLSYA